MRKHIKEEQTFNVRVTPKSGQKATTYGLKASSKEDALDKASEKFQKDHKAVKDFDIKIVRFDESTEVAPAEEKEMRYADELASRLPKDIQTEDEILEAAHKLAVKDIGPRSAEYYFRHDEDFPGDVVTEYHRLNPKHQAESLGQMFMKKYLAQEGVVDTVKKGIKSVKRGMAGWGGEQGSPAEIVKRNKEWDDEKLAKLDIRNKISDFDKIVDPKSPRGLQVKVIDREMKKRGLTKEGADKETLGQKIAGKIMKVPASAIECFEAKDDSYYTTSASKAAELMKERFGPTTRSTDKDGRWIFKDKNGAEVALSDIDGEGDRTWNIFKSKALKEWSLEYDTDWKKNIDPADLEKELIAYLKKKGGKVWFKDDAYAYLMDASKPTTLVASDGSVIKVKKLIDVEKYVDKGNFVDFAEADPEDWDDFFRPVKKGASNDQADHETKSRVGESLIRDMMKMIPRGILGESVDAGAVRALSDAKLVKMIKDFESQVKMGDASAKKGLKALQDESKRRDSAGHVEEAVNPVFTAYDVHHTPDGVMVLVFGPDDSAQDDYYGINVVFGKPGTKPKLVTSDDLADLQAAKYKNQIIAAAEKRLCKEDKAFLASL